MLTVLKKVQRSRWSPRSGLSCLNKSFSGQSEPASISLNRDLLPLTAAENKAAAISPPKIKQEILSSSNSGAVSLLTTPSHLPSPARAYGFLRAGVFSTRLARSFIFGSACVFTTRSGMVLSCSRQVAITPLCSPACSRYKRRDATESISHICRRHQAARLDPPLAVGRGPKVPTLLDAFTHILIVIRPH